MKTEFIIFLTLSFSLSAWSARRHTDKENVSVSGERKSLFENIDGFSSPSTLGILSSIHAHKNALSIRVTARTRCAEQE